MSENQPEPQTTEPEAPQDEQKPEPDQTQAPDTEGAGTAGTDEPQVGRRPEFVGEQAEEGSEE